MTPQERELIDREITQGRMIRAVQLYRAATGSSLAVASQVVHLRAAELGAGTQSPLPTLGARKSPAVSYLILAAVLIPVAIAAYAVFGGTSAVFTPRKTALGAMLPREPYYAHAVRDIAGFDDFRVALGSPIAIDQSGITCSGLADGPTSRTADCTLPVHGPKASGTMTVDIVDSSASFVVVAKLTMPAGQTFEMDESHEVRAARG